MTVGLAQDRQLLESEHDLDASCGARLAPDEACLFECDNHLVDGGCGHLEVAPHISLGRWPFKDPAVGVYEGQVLALKLREARTFRRLLSGKYLTHL